MNELLEHKRDIFLIFVIGFCLSMMSLYQTYAYDIESEEQVIRPTPDLRYTFNLTDNNSDTYTINLGPGETKLLDLTLTNDNDYNIKYSLYTDKEIEDNTILSALNTSSHNSIGIISKNPDGQSLYPFYCNNATKYRFVYLLEKDLEVKQ